MTTNEKMALTIFQKIIETEDITIAKSLAQVGVLGLQGKGEKNCVIVRTQARAQHKICAMREFRKGFAKSVAGAKTAINATQGEIIWSFMTYALARKLMNQINKSKALAGLFEIVEIRIKKVTE